MKPSAPRIKERKASSFLENSERIAWVGHFTTKKRTILTDMNKDLQMISSFLYLSLFFSEILRFSLIFSTYLGFSSYLCSRNSAARKKGGGVIIFIKVLKNDAALPSAMDSRAFIVFFVTETLHFQIFFVTLRQKIKH